MGAETGLLVYADGDVPGALRRAGAADLDRTVTMMRRLYPGWRIEECEGSTLVTASAGRRLVLHAMHSVVDWLVFAVWEDGHLVRSLSLAPDNGIIENIGEPLPFELPYWAGDRPADVFPWPDEDEDSYPLPFHPLELGEDALRALCGCTQEGRPEPDDVDADNIRLHGFQARGPHGPDPQATPDRRAKSNVMAAMMANAKLSASASSTTR
ncbi:DUF6928 family protein [Streptomyces griseoluteus]|uniref:DUF6928 family protein n=1 Tax=Streptomyces griseoluteus TaxID=29306 RepID=UPI0036FD263F